MLEMYTVVDLDDILGTRLSGFKCGFLGGSRAMVDPAPTDTDMDVCLHVESVEEAVHELQEVGYELPDIGNLYEGEYYSFLTMRKGEVNLLIFEDAYEFGAVWGATAYGKHMNIKSKSDRYSLFEKVRSPWRLQDV